MHLVLDLDETLISVSMNPIKDPDFKFSLQGTIYYGKKRPGLDLFLTFAFKRFQTVNVWTAATWEYAHRVLNHIMTAEQRSRLAFFKTRKDLAAFNEGPYYKPLEKIFSDPKAKKLGLTKANTIMIDDRDDVLRDNPGNGIMIPPWKGRKNDKYLPKLLIVLDGALHHNLGFGHFGHVFDLRQLVD
jgi:TFIIF-interacting CTD phosphatase-like protein